MRLEQAPRGWGSHCDNAAPRLSIVVPVHDGAATLPACLKALIEAPGPSREIIVSDDGSLDQSATIAASTGVVTLRSSAKRGAGAARNAGAAEARADILVFVDADVVIHPDALMRIACFFDENPNYAGCSALMTQNQLRRISSANTAIFFTISRIRTDASRLRLSGPALAPSGDRSSSRVTGFATTHAASRMSNWV